MASISGPSPQVSGSDSSFYQSRVQISDAHSYDGPPDNLSLLVHTYEVNSVGAPALLLLPLQTSNMDQSSELYRKYLNKQVQRDIEKILSKYEIEVELQDLVLRHIDDDVPTTANAIATLYIRTPQGFVFQAANQRNCVADLYNLLQALKIFGPQGAVTVELIGYELRGLRGISHVEVNHPFHVAWETSLRQSFLNFIAVFQKLAGKFYSIDVVRLGFDRENPAKNPVVVSITVDWSLDPPDYESIKSGMLRSLRDAGFPSVRVEFERGEVW